MFILIGPHVKHFNDGNQTVCPTLKNKLWPLIMPKQRERCLALPTLLQTTTCCIITGLFISLKMHYENVSEKEPISANAGATKRALK
jgi:hypothetical protein